MSEGIGLYAGPDGSFGNGLASGEMVKACPACGETWVVEARVAAQWVGVKWERDESALSRVLGHLPAADFAPFYDMLEAVFRAHVAQDCPHPRLILEMLKEATG